MANLQPLLPNKPSAIFPPIAPAPAAIDLSGMSSGPNPLGTIASIAPPPLATVGLDPRAALAQKNSDDLADRASADSADLFKRSHPTKPTSTLGKIGHVAANIGNVLGDIFAPSTMALIPGTQLNNEVAMNRDRADLDQVSKLQNEAANTKLLDATPQLKQQSAEIQQLRAQGYLQHVNDLGQHYDQQNDAQLAQHGYKRDPQGQIVPMSYQELSPEMQAVEDLKQSQAELADANKAYADAKTKNLPAQMQMAEQRVLTAQMNANTALQKLRSNGMDDNDPALVDMVAHGQMPIGRLSYILTRNPQLMGEVAKVDPSFDGSKVESYAKTYQDFTSGKTSRQLNSGGTAIGHLLELQQLNTPASHIPGTPDWTAYHNKLDTVASELATFYGDATIPAIEKISSTLGSNLPGTRDRAIRTQAQSMSDKFNSYEQQWHNAAPSAAYEAPMPGVSEEALSALHQLAPQSSYAQHHGGNASGGAKTYKQMATNGQQRIGSNDGGQTWFDVKTGREVK